jgi:hypothetical protein
LVAKAGHCDDQSRNSSRRDMLIITLSFVHLALKCYRAEASECVCVCVCAGASLDHLQLSADGDGVEWADDKVRRLIDYIWRQVFIREAELLDSKHKHTNKHSHHLTWQVSLKLGLYDKLDHSSVVKVDGGRCCLHVCVYTAVFMYIGMYVFYVSIYACIWINWFRV